MRIEGEGTKNTDRDDRLSVDRRGMEQAETMHATARDRAAAASAAASAAAAAAAAAAASPAAAAAAAAVAAGSCCCSILAIAISTCDSEYLQQGKAEQSQARVPRPAPRARARGVWLHLRGGDRRTLKLPVLEACCGTSSTFNLGMEKKTFPSKQRAQIFAKFGLPLEPIVVYI